MNEEIERKIERAQAAMLELRANIKALEDRAKMYSINGDTENLKKMTDAIAAIVDD